MQDEEKANPKLLVVLELDGSVQANAIYRRVPSDGLRLGELSDGAAQRADAIFDWRPLPWCPEIF
jgi:hypothetical protein